MRRAAFLELNFIKKYVEFRRVVFLLTFSVEFNSTKFEKECDLCVR